MSELKSSALPRRSSGLDGVDPGQETAILAVDAPAIAREGILQHSFSVGCPGVDREIGLDAEMHAMLAQHLCAEPVEGVDVGAFLEPGRKGGQPARHLVGGLVRERQREDAEALVRRSIEQARDPASQYAGLAGAGTGQHEQRAVVPLDRLALDVRQLVQRGLELGSHQVRPRSCSMAARNASGVRCAKSASRRTRAANSAALAVLSARKRTTRSASSNACTSRMPNAASISRNSGPSPSATSCASRSPAAWVRQRWLNSSTLNPRLAIARTNSRPASSPSNTASHGTPSARARAAKVAGLPLFWASTTETPCWSRS